MTYEEILELAKTDRVRAGVALTTGLMRGDPATYKQGYSLGSALIASYEQLDLSLTDVCIVAEKVTDLDGGAVILVETNGSDPEVTTQLRGRQEATFIHIDWFEVHESTSPGYIQDILDDIESADVRHVNPKNHVGMGEVVRQLREKLVEIDT